MKLKSDIYGKNIYRMNFVLVKIMKTISIIKIFKNITQKIEIDSQHSVCQKK